MSRKSPPQAAQDNRANQLNPVHPAFHRARGGSMSSAEAAAALARAAAEKRANPGATPSNKPD
jgi:hypothetical protein